MSLGISNSILEKGHRKTGNWKEKEKAYHKQMDGQKVTVAVKKRIQEMEKTQEIELQMRQKDQGNERGEKIPFLYIYAFKKTRKGKKYSFSL